jgi:hypothetical protein
MLPEIKPPDEEDIATLLPESPTAKDAQLQELQEELTNERDARREDRFVFIVVIVLLLDVVFFTVMPSFGGPLALLVLELLILIPLAQRMGMEEIAAILDRVLRRVADKASGSDT